MIRDTQCFTGASIWAGGEDGRKFSRKASEPTVRGLGTASLYFTKPRPLTPHASPCERPSIGSLPISVDVWQGLLGSVAHLPMELGEVQLLRLQVPGGTTRGQGRATNVRQEARWVGRGGHPQGRAEACLFRPIWNELKVSDILLSSTYAP